MFQSSLKEAQALLSNYLPKTGNYYKEKRNYSFDYERNSNTTSLLSPYIRYRLLSEENILKKIISTHLFIEAEKFIQEIYWRTYWKGWLEHRKEVYDNYIDDRNILLKESINNQIYRDALNASTELNFFNGWVSDLKINGYLHNHIRMWFASIWIFTLKLPWQLGANFFMENLLDGDPASNTLSWRWVAGVQTKGKHYLARKSNIIKFSNTLIDDKIEINEKAFPKIEDKEYLIKEIKYYNNILSDNVISILIPSDELNFVKDYKHKFKYIFSGIPFEDYNDHEFSQKIKSHLKKIIISNFNDDKFYQNYNFEIHFDNFYNKFNDWVLKNKIKEVVIPYVTKGNWGKIYQKIITKNPNINFIYLNRKYDIDSFQYTKKGFFNFKKHIPALISNL